MCTSVKNLDKCVQSFQLWRQQRDADWALNGSGGRLFSSPLCVWDVNYQVNISEEVVSIGHCIGTLEAVSEVLRTCRPSSQIYDSLSHTESRVISPATNLSGGFVQVLCSNFDSVVRLRTSPSVVECLHHSVYDLCLQIRRKNMEAVGAGLVLVFEYEQKQNAIIRNANLDPPLNNLTLIKA